MTGESDGDRSAEELRIEDLRVATGKGIPLLRGVSVSLGAGEVVGLIGESGSGKTMTCRAVTGTLPGGARVTGGSIRVGEHSLTRSDRGAGSAARAGVAMIFADPHSALDPLQRVGSQIAEMARVHRGLSRSDAKALAVELLSKLAINDPGAVVRQFPHEISGGMAQRVMIASVLAGRPRFILADEPTSALDATVQLDILDLLMDIVKSEGVGLMLTTHDMVAAARISDRVCVMYAGRIVEEGAARVVLDRPSHPYTQALIRSRPVGTKLERLAAIPGESPTSGTVPDGCAFAPRCAFARERCRIDLPELRAISSDDMAACHFAEEIQEVVSA